jgi:hypothetical protein
MDVSMTLLLPKETIAELKAQAESDGFLTADLLARHLVVSGLKRLKRGEQGMAELFDFLVAKRGVKREGDGNE